MGDFYMDYASTTPPHPAAVEAMARAAAEQWGDPSRLYRAARVARMALDEARSSVAEALGARPEEIVFTSGGTESCNLAVRAGALAAAAARKPKRIAVSAVEHSSVLEAARAMEPLGFEVVVLPVDGHGRISVKGLADACREGLGFVSIQFANNEVGTMQPLAEAGRVAREAGAIVHTDACAAIGHVPVDVGTLQADLLSASSHKSYGPKGAGLLWARRSIRIRPSMVGDDRERGRRAGLENLAAVAGFAAALRARSEEIAAEVPRLISLTAHLRSEVPALIPEASPLGDPEHRLPGLVAFSFSDLEGEALLLGLDAKGIAVHSGSSCTSSPQEPSHVLSAMGAPATGSLRVSLGRGSSPEDVDAFLAELPGVVKAARAMTNPL